MPPESKKYVASLAVALVVGMAIGRYTLPERVKIEKQTVTVEVEKKDTTKSRTTDEDKKTTTFELTKPDGTKVRKQVIESDRKTESNTHQTVDKKNESQTTETKVVENSRRVNLSVIGGLNFTDLKQPVVFGGHISRPFLGPITLGIWGLSNAVGGVSVGLQF